LDRQQHIVHVFDSQGKFIFKIDKRGQGPGEYPFLDDIYINSFTGHLELLCAMGFVYEYDLSGKFVKMTRVTNEHLRAVHEIISLDKNITVFHARAEPKKIFYYSLEKGEILHEEFDENRYLGSFADYSFYRYNGDWHFFRPFDNHVYKVGNEHLEEVYAWNFGKLNQDFRKARFSQDAWNNPPKMFEEANALFPWRIFALGQTNKYVIAQFILKGKFVNVIYDKTIQQCKYIPLFAESVGLKPYLVTNEYVLSFCNPGELEQYLTEDMLDEPNREIFNELIHSTDANPIIIKYYFK
jgi:hypothetical protein